MYSVGNAYNVIVYSKMDAIFIFYEVAYRRLKKVIGSNVPERVRLRLTFHDEFGLLAIKARYTFSKTPVVASVRSGHVSDEQTALRLGVVHGVDPGALRRSLELV